MRRAQKHEFFRSEMYIYIVIDLFNPFWIPVRDASGASDEAFTWFRQLRQVSFKTVNFLICLLWKITLYVIWFTLTKSLFVILVVCNMRSVCLFIYIDLNIFICLFNLFSLRKQILEASHIYVRDMRFDYEN